MGCCECGNEPLGLFGVGGIISLLAEDLFSVE
jgi:hypothetical protein